MRRTRLALVGGLVAAALAGCTITVAGHGTPGDDEIAAAPRPGSCWQLGTSDFGSALDQPTRLPCAKAHDTEVVRVAENAIDRQRDYPTRSQLALPSSAVARALDDACDYLAVATYLGDDAAMHAPFVDIEPRLPSRAQWAAGARWVRCDVVYGIDEPQPAPGVMAGALQGPQTAAYRACYAGTPTDHVVVACSAPHQAEIVPDGLFLTSPTPYPTQDGARQALAQSVCAEPLTIDLASAPAPPEVALDLYLESPDPDTGDPSATCVLVHPDGAVTSTVVLP